MAVAFMGEPRSLGTVDGSAVEGFAIDADVDGITVECTITEEAVFEVARHRASEGGAMVRGFRDHEQRFRDLVDAKVGRAADFPDRLTIGSADVLRGRR